MSIWIDKKECVGCGKCADICPGNLIYKDEMGKASIRNPRDCWGCAACVKECKVLAIEYYLGADIGGKGTVMYVKKENNLLYWYFKRPNGENEAIVVNIKDSKSY